MNIKKEIKKKEIKINEMKEIYNIASFLSLFSTFYIQIFIN